MKAADTADLACVHESCSTNTSLQHASPAAAQQAASSCYGSFTACSSLLGMLSRCYHSLERLPCQPCRCQEQLSGSYQGQHIMAACARSCWTAELQLHRA